ncbi:MAG: rubredoxin [Lachnospiraceae bacterium]|nr:rubredoxin [Lachnospiraceae bacterium]
MRYICSICGYVYDEAGNVPWADLPEDWKCPLCGAAKADFVPEGAAPSAADTDAVSSEAAALKPLSAIETAALCSNLARGCEKQYLPEQAAAFRKLADWFGTQYEKPADPSFSRLLELVNADLGTLFPAANAAAKENGDRGALRSLVWSEKVTRILKSLLTRYEREGDTLPENTGVYVCTICGFVYVGDTLPEVCPVCKVPNRKFEKIGG